MVDGELHEDGCEEVEVGTSPVPAVPCSHPSPSPASPPAVALAWARWAWRFPSFPFTSLPFPVNANLPSSFPRTEHAGPNLHPARFLSAATKSHLSRLETSPSFRGDLHRFRVYSAHPLAVHLIPGADSKIETLPSKAQGTTTSSEPNRPAFDTSVLLELPVLSSPARTSFYCHQITCTGPCTKVVFPRKLITWRF